MKLCKVCKTNKNLTDFTKCKNSSDGYYHDCKTCRAKWMKEYRKKRPDYFKEVEFNRYPDKRLNELKRKSVDKYEKHKVKYEEYRNKNREQRAITKKLWDEKNKLLSKEKAKIYRQNNKDFIAKRSKNTRLKKEYNITLDDYNRMFERQNGKCAICLLPSKLALHVDHSHSTGQNRELLCTNCNTGLGQFKDNISFLNSAIKYLVKHGK